MDPDPGGPKTCGSVGSGYGSGSGTLAQAIVLDHIMQDYSLFSLQHVPMKRITPKADVQTLAVLLNIFLPWTHSHKAISTKRRDLRMCLAAVHSTCRICPSYKHFPPTPVLFIEYTPNPPLFREGIIVPSFTKTPSLWSSCSMCS